MDARPTESPKPSTTKVFLKARQETAVDVSDTVVFRYTDGQHYNTMTVLGEVGRGQWGAVFSLEGAVAFHKDVNRGGKWCLPSLPQSCDRRAPSGGFRAPQGGPSVVMAILHGPVPLATADWALGQVGAVRAGIFPWSRKRARQPQEGKVRSHHYLHSVSRRRNWSTEGDGVAGM